MPAVALDVFGDSEVEFGGEGGGACCLLAHFPISLLAKGQYLGYFSGNSALLRCDMLGMTVTSALLFSFDPMTVLTEMRAREASSPCPVSIAPKHGFQQFPQVEATGLSGNKKFGQNLKPYAHCFLPGLHSAYEHQCVPRCFVLIFKGKFVFPRKEASQKGSMRSGKVSVQVIKK